MAKMTGNALDFLVILFGKMLQNISEINFQGGGKKASSGRSLSRCP